MFRFGCVLLVVVLASLAIQIEGSCLRGILESSTTVDDSSNNVTEQYCEYLEEKHAVNTTWTYAYPTCFNCECNTYGLSCCGYGIKAGVIVPPEDCKLAEGTCDIEFVKQSDSSESCFDSESSDST